MAIAGRVAIVPKGEWSADAAYKRLDAVTYNNTLYFAKKEVPAGTVTSNTEYWSKSIAGSAGSIATTENAGIVKPDGRTITIDEDGTIHGQSEIAVDGTTITIDEAKGIISLAKTLQDKIKTIDNKLPKTSVVNTNTTTEAGFALDARQANPEIEGTMANQILQLNNDFLKTNHIGSDSIATFADFYVNQKSTFLVIVSDGNNALNKEIFGFDNDNYNNGFGCVILSVKIIDWRGFALAIPLDMWGVGCYIGQINGDVRKFSWTQISMM